MLIEWWTMLNLTSDERTWLDAYLDVLAENFPGLVEEVKVFGSKARGDSRPGSDLDLLVIIARGDWQIKHEVRLPGYRLATGTETVPSIKVYTRGEWEDRRAHRSVFLEAVERDAVKVV